MQLYISLGIMVQPISLKLVHVQAMDMVNNQ
jgi:hypothetical protein